MTFTRTIYAALSVAVIAGTFTAPAFAQNRFMDQAKESANRRAENKAVREAEHPDAVAPAAATASTATPKPAETTPAAQTAPVAPVAPAAPAAPAAAPAPAPAQ
jgi:hypothetical protein